MVADVPDAVEVDSEAAPLFTLVAFQFEVLEWFSLVVSERREVLDQLNVSLSYLGLQCRVVECLDGYGVDGKDIMLIGDPLRMPDDARVHWAADLE